MLRWCCPRGHVEFNDETYGETRGVMVAEPETYGTDKLIKPISIDVDSDTNSSPPEDTDEDEDE